MAAKADESCVRVAVRARPLSFKEKDEGATSCVTVLPSQNQVVVGKAGAGDENSTFTFDYVLDPESNQVHVLIWQDALSHLLVSITTQ
jgi:hypothetical protein